MSVEGMARVLNGTTGLSPAEKLVLLGIANHDGDGGAWPSIATLARYTETSTRSVQRHIAKLVAAGYVTVELQAGGTRDTRSDRRPNRYVIHYRALISQAGDNPVGRDDSPVTPPPSRGDSPVTHGVTPVSPEPSKNHPEDNRRHSYIGDGQMCVEDGCQNMAPRGRFRCHSCKPARTKKPTTPENVEEPK